MKKWTLVLISVCMLLFGSTAYAAENHGKKDDHKDYKDDYKNCATVVNALQKVLEKAKNEKGKQAIRKTLDEYKKKCEQANPPVQMKDDQRVQSDKAALKINYASGDSSARVTQSIQLPTRGAKGSTIAWTSGTPTFLTNDGRLVSRPPTISGDVTIVMFAVIQYNQSRDFKMFTITIKPQLADADRVAADKALLGIDFGGSDSAVSVTRPFDRLPTTGPNGSQITWTSGNPNVISNDGKTVNRPAYGAGDLTVVMTALIRSGGFVDIKVFVVTVKQDVGDANSVAADKAALEIDFGGSDTVSSVTRAFDRLPTAGANGSQITWTSSAPNIISHDGKTVNRPVRGSGDAIVVFTAIIKNGAASDSKIFVLTVKQIYNDEETVAADKAELAVIYSGSDTANRVTRDVTLAVKGHYGSNIIWVSDKPAVVSNNGKVTRPSRSAGDAAVILTAVIISNGRADYKTFALIVKSN